MLTYFLISNLSLCLFYAVYWAFLRQETFFRLNRVYLLLVAMFSLVMPLVDFSPIAQSEIIGNQLFTVIPDFDVLPTSSEKNSEAPSANDTINAVITESQIAYFQLFTNYWQEILLSMYEIGVLIFAFKFLKGIKGIYAMIRKNGKIKQSKYYLVHYEGNRGVFSFLNYLFWSKQVTENELIKKHELAHIYQKHSLDILFFEVLGIVFWCNPVIFLYQKSIRLVHEYLADEAVTLHLPLKTHYAHTLVAHATEGATFQLTHHFYHQQTLKQRIMKMYQEKSKTKHKYWLALPVIVLCLFVAACTKQNIQLEEKQVESLELSKEIPDYIPQDFQEKIKALQVQYPNHFFDFHAREAKYLQKDLEESDEEVNYWQKIMYHRPISTQEDTRYMEGEFSKYRQRIIEEYGTDSKQFIAHQNVMKPSPSKEQMTGYIYMHKRSESSDEDWESEDNTVYTEVDTYPSPRDGANFYEEMLRLVRLPEHFRPLNPDDLQGDIILEMIVNKSGYLVKVNLVEGVQINRDKIKQSLLMLTLRNRDISNEELNGVFFRAFTERSELRGWKIGIKNGKRVDTKIRFKIPLEMIKKAMSC